MAQDFSRLLVCFLLLTGISCNKPLIKHTEDPPLIHGKITRAYAEQAWATLPDIFAEINAPKFPDEIVYVI